MSKIGNYYQSVQQTDEYREGWEAAAHGNAMPDGEIQRVGFNDARVFRAEGGDPMDALVAAGDA